ncbi:MAG: response regulator [Nitrospirae bacterium]|nr:response regulator [Nitrospirota bacterium]
MNEQARYDISILYVEDEPSTREEVLLFLQRRVREVFAAADGREGLELFRQYAPDLVITDIRMPVMDGLEMAKTIKAIDREAKIIVTSAHSDTPYLLSAIETGIDAYVMKPVDTEKLLAAIQKCSEVIEYRKRELLYQQEQRKSMEQLQAALSNVKLLSGFLPICAACKKIRDDKGYWQQIEAYIRDHSEAEFSHGICPDCAKKLYPDIYKEE